MPSDTAENEENSKERENENENEKKGEIDFNAENTDAQNNSNNAGPSLLIQSPLEHPLVKIGIRAHDLAEFFLAPANTVTQKTSKHQEQS